MRGAVLEQNLLFGQLIRCEYDAVEEEEEETYGALSETQECSTT